MGSKQRAVGYWWVKFYNGNDDKILFWDGDKFQGFPGDRADDEIKSIGGFIPPLVERGVGDDRYIRLRRKVRNALTPHWKSNPAVTDDDIASVISQLISSYTGVLTTLSRQPSNGDKIYVILVQDRHSDPSVKVYKSKEVAIEKAREMAHEYCRFPDDYEEHDYKGMVFHADYSCESDTVTVLEVTLNDGN